jgi:hypothetical protein
MISSLPTKTLYILPFLFLVVEFSFAQGKSTGINNVSPSTNAALHVSSFGKQGILIPRLVAKDTSTISVTAKDLGLLFYDSVGTKFWYYTGAKWAYYPSSPPPSIGTGITNRVAYWNTATTLSSSPVYVNGTNVGINIDPVTAFTFQVNDPSNVASSIQLIAGTATGSGPGKGLLLQVNATSANIVNYGTGSFNLQNNGGTWLTISSTGVLQAKSLIGPGTVVADNLGNLSLNTNPLISGTGALNQLAYWNTATTLGSSPVYVSGTKIGINIAPTTYAFQVNDPSNSSSSFQLTAGTATGTGSAKGLVFQVNTTSANMINYSATPLNFGTNGANRFVISATGLLQASSLAGPGTIVSDVSGNLSVNTTPLLSGTGVLNKVAVWSGASTLKTGLITDDGANVYIGTVGASPTSDLYITKANPVGLKLNNSNASTALAIRTGYAASLVHTFEFSHDIVFSGVTYANVGVGTSPTNYVRVNNTGNVGLGVNPTARFHSYSTSNLNALFESNSTVGTWVGFHNSSTGGQYFSILCSGSGNGEGAGKLLFTKNVAQGTVNGHFMAMDYTTGFITLGGTGATTPTQMLHVIGNAYKTVGTNVWLIPSDRRLKENIHPFNEGLSTILQINPVSFSFNGKAGTKKGTKEYGVIAQEIQKVAPYTVSKGIKTKLEPSDTTETELLAYDSGPLLYVLINSIKELNHKVDSLNAELNKVKYQNGSLSDPKKTASIAK